MVFCKSISVRCLARVGAPLLLVSLIAACGKGGGGGEGGHGFGGGQPAQVQVMTVQSQTLPVSFEYTGQTQGAREVEVRARVTGILLKRNYEEGQTVRAGQSLFTIDPAPFETALARAEADQAAVAARLSNAQRNLARIRPLAEGDAVSKRDFDEALSAEQVAAADLKAAQARVSEAKLNLGYTRVVAPVTGQAGGANKSEGSLISGPDVLLTTIVQNDTIKAVFGVPDAEHARIQADQRAGRLKMPAGGFSVEVLSADGTPMAKGGRLQFSEPLVDAATGTVRSQAMLPNRDGSIKPGQFVRVRLTGATRPDVMQVPQRAVLEGPQGKFVYVVEKSDKPEMKGAEVATVRPVQAADWVDLPDGKGWVIREGLKPGDRVIVDGLMRIGPGAPVTTAAPGAPGGAPAAAASAPASAASAPASAASK